MIKIKFLLVAVAMVLATVSCSPSSADDSTALNDAKADATTSATAIVDHPPLFVRGKHDEKWYAQTKMTYEQYVKFFIKNGNIKLSLSEFYAKNPEWRKFKDKKMVGQLPGHKYVKYGVYL